MTRYVPFEQQRVVPAPRREAELLGWGIRRSFLAYVLGVGGAVTVSDGASDRGDYFAFPVVGSDENEVRSAGAVRVRAHDGLLDLSLSDLHLRTHQGVDELNVLVDGRRKIMGLASSPQASEDEHTSAFLLQPDAVPLFNNSYAAGSLMDSVKFLRYAND